MENFTFQTAVPETQGVSSAAICDFVRRLSVLDYIHSFMLLRHDKLIAQTWWEPFKPEYKHELFSASKSFTSAAIGIAQGEGLLKLSDRLVSFFPEKLNENVSEKMRQVTLRNLLTMASGHESCPLMKLHTMQDWVQGFLESELKFDPGTKFVYNSAATYMLAAVIRKVTGQNVIDYLQERLFRPLGIKAEKWDSCPQGTNIGGWGFWLKTEDLLRFGRLLLNNGSWEGRQLIPAEYLKEATSFQIDNSTNDQPDWKLGYGYQFWRTSFNSFRGDGACGQYILVMPEKDLVLAVTSGVSNMQNILTAFWETVYASLQDAPAAEDRTAATELEMLLASRKHAPAASALVQHPSDRIYKMQENSIGLDTLEITFTDEDCSLIFNWQDGTAEKLSARYGEHTLNELQLKENEVRILAASAAWQSKEQLELVVFAVETPFRDVYDICFSGNTVRLERTAKLEFLHDRWPVLEGEQL
ncbi:MAG: serine hydrolase [Lentisphaeria bacterium]|nr:serine hydrolase [Lentisphaeria bacterium]